MAQVALILGVVALVLGGSAVGIALTHAGPTGPTGTAGTDGTQGAQGVQGPPGPAGPGAVFTTSAWRFGGAEINTTCASMTEILLNFNVTLPGTVFVTATLVITLTHTSGNQAAAALTVSDSNTTCPGTPSYALVTSSAPTGTYYTDVAVEGLFTVPSAGTYSYYITGYDYSSGGDTTSFGWANAVGAYYPS
jgi:hypothetical protein